MPTATEPIVNETSVDAFANLRAMMQARPQPITTVRKSARAEKRTNVVIPPEIQAFVNEIMPTVHIWESTAQSGDFAPCLFVPEALTIGGRSYSREELAPMFVGAIREWITTTPINGGAVGKLHNTEYSPPIKGVNNHNSFKVIYCGAIPETKLWNSKKMQAEKREQMGVSLDIYRFWIVANRQIKDLGIVA